MFIVASKSLSIFKNEIFSKNPEEDIALTVWHTCLKITYALTHDKRHLEVKIQIKISYTYTSTRGWRAKRFKLFFGYVRFLTPQKSTASHILALLHSSFRTEKTALSSTTKRWAQERVIIYCWPTTAALACYYPQEAQFPKNGVSLWAQLFLSSFPLSFFDRITRKAFLNLQREFFLSSPLFFVLFVVKKKQEIDALISSCETLWRHQRLKFLKTKLFNPFKSQPIWLLKYRR